MSTHTESRPAGLASWLAAAVLSLVFCGVVLWAIVTATGYFRLSPDTAALRTSFMTSMPGEWNKKIALRVGWGTTGIVRMATRFFDLPEEPRAALAAVRGGEVGIYQLLDRAVNLDYRAVLKSTDRAMKERGWERIVGVTEEGQLVAVYWPSRSTPLNRVKCCVLVFQGHELIVTSARANLEPLLQLATRHIDLSELKRHLRQGG